MIFDKFSLILTNFCKFLTNSIDFRQIFVDFWRIFEKLLYIFGNFSIKMQNFFCQNKILSKTGIKLENYWMTSFGIFRQNRHKSGRHKSGTRLYIIQCIILLILSPWDFRNPYNNYLRNFFKCRGHKIWFYDSWRPRDHTSILEIYIL